MLALYRGRLGVTAYCVWCATERDQSRVAGVGHPAEVKVAADRAQQSDGPVAQ